MYCQVNELYIYHGREIFKGLWASPPKQGVYNLPNCGTNDDDPGDQPTAMCLTVQSLIARSAYLPFVRDHLVQAQYFKVRLPAQLGPVAPAPRPLGLLRGFACMNACFLPFGDGTRLRRGALEILHRILI